MHNLETFANGRTGFVTAREPAWHKLGTVADGALTAQEAADAALLGGWNVRKLPITVTEINADGVSQAVVPEKYATVRTNPVTKQIDALGVVGERYKIVQNEEAFEVLDLIADESGAHFETAGSLGRGERVFMSMKLPDGIQVAGADAHELYLLAYNSHDGSSAFTLAVTPVRVVCQNTLTFGLSQAKQTFTIRHTSSAHGRIAEAREALKVTWKYADAWTEQLTRFLDEEFTRTQFRELTEQLVPDSASEKAGHVARVTAQRDSLSSLFIYADTQEFGRGTKYAAFNAIVEYADWFMPLRGEDASGVKRAQRAMTPTSSVQTFKDKGLALLTR